MSWTPLSPGEQREQCNIPLPSKRWRELRALPQQWAGEQGVPQKLGLQAGVGSQRRRIWVERSTGEVVLAPAGCRVCVAQGELTWLIAGFIFRWEIDWANSKAQRYPPQVF